MLSYMIITSDRRTLSLRLQVLGPRLFHPTVRDSLHKEKTRCSQKKYAGVWTKELWDDNDDKKAE